jgi:hypothetical protein
VFVVVLASTVNIFPVAETVNLQVAVLFPGVAVAVIFTVPAR